LGQISWRFTYLCWNIPSYEKIGDVDSAQGDLPSALSSYKEGLQIRQKLAARDPGNAQWQTDLVISQWKLAVVLE
jgi:hypothetical protein